MTHMRQSIHSSVDLEENGVAVVQIRDAGALNVLSTPVVMDLTAQLTKLADEAGLRAVVLRGSGNRAFVGGADIKEMAGLDRDGARSFISRLEVLCELVRHFPVPVIARLAGWSLGAGLELAAACDTRICTSDAHFGMPEVAVGIPSVIHAVLLPRLIGGARAHQLILTAQPIDATTALNWGLVDDICDLEELDGRVDAAAQVFLTLAPQAVRQQKRLLRSWEDVPVAEGIRMSIEEFASAFDTGEPQEYMNEFLNRRDLRRET